MKNGLKIPFIQQGIGNSFIEIPAGEKTDMVNDKWENIQCSLSH